MYRRIYASYIAGVAVLIWRNKNTGTDRPDPANGDRTDSPVTVSHHGEDGGTGDESADEVRR
jgi:hypothetical protein